MQRILATHRDGSPALWLEHDDDQPPTLNDDRTSIRLTAAELDDLETIVAQWLAATDPESVATRG